MSEFVIPVEKIGSVVGIVWLTHDVYVVYNFIGPAKGITVSMSVKKYLAYSTIYFM